MAIDQRTYDELRAAPRDAVHFRARALVDRGRAVMLTVVNLSPGGLMARTDDAFATGDGLSLTLPQIGAVAAEVRWALGGRIGCALAPTIAAEAYRSLIAEVGER